MAGTLKVGGKVLATHNSETDEVSLASDTNIKSALNASGDAPIYACRAWVNFSGSNYTSINGEDLCTINASGNINKVVRTSIGRYKLYFETPMPDVNYCVNPSIQYHNPTYSYTLHPMIDYGTGLAANSFDIAITRNRTSTEVDDADTDPPLVFVSIFR